MKCQAAVSFGVLLCRAALGSQLYTGRMQPEKRRSAFANRNYAEGHFSMWLNQEFFEPRLNTWHQEASVLARASAGCELLRQRAGGTGHVMSWTTPEKGLSFFVYLCVFFFNLTRSHR